MREYFESLEEQVLSPLGVRSVSSKGRAHAEPLDPTRTCFQRDRDRIVHSKSFRRLRHKTQVIVSTLQDHVRSRLTHSIEVSQISRHMARLLRLNEDLTEAIALAHDLGHPPFGHAGEAQLNALMANNGGFEHNQHALRIVDYLESKYPNFPGLNLSYEVRCGMNKHRTPYDAPEALENLNFISLEAQVVNIADEITYNAHDIDDAIRSNILTDTDLVNNVTLWREFSNAILSQYTNLSDNQYTYLMNSRLITGQIMNVITQSQKNVTQSGLETNAELQGYSTHDWIAFDTECREKINELRHYLFENYYSNHDIYRSNKRGQLMIQHLFQAFVSDQKLMPMAFVSDGNHRSAHQVACDYIAGMTDSFVNREYQSIYH